MHFTVANKLTPIKWSSIQKIFSREHTPQSLMAMCRGRLEQDNFFIFRDDLIFSHNNDNPNNCINTQQQQHDISKYFSGNKYRKLKFLLSKDLTSNAMICIFICVMNKLQL